MESLELVSIVIAGTLLALAAVSAWVESRVERRDTPDYLRRLRQERRFREHVARGPVVERRRVGRQRVRHPSALETMARSALAGLTAPPARGASPQALPEAPPAQAAAPADQEEA